MRIHSTVEASRVNGPGLRSVIWVQGCEIGCLGCWNPETHARDGGEIWSIYTLLAWLKVQSDDYKIDGVTISGGEPMHQADELACLLTVLKSRAPWLTLGMYSGYPEKTLDSGNYRHYNHGFDMAYDREQRAALWQNDIKPNLDFAVLGPYNQQLVVIEPLVTSSNQDLKLYSKAYTMADFKNQQVEMTINEDGSFSTLTGFPRKENACEVMTILK